MHPPSLVVTLAIATSCLAQAAGPDHAAGSPGTPPPLAVVGATVVDVVAGSARPGMTVLIRGGRIEAVQPDGDVRLPEDVQRLDAHGKFIIPGFWDMHVHLTSLGAECLPLFLVHGVTGVRDMGGDFPRVKDWRDRVAAGALRGPRIKAAGPIIEDGRWVNAIRRMESKAGLNSDWLNERIAVRTPQEGRAVVAHAAEQGADLIKIRNSPPRESFLALADEAKRRGLPLAGHNPTTVKLIEASDAGMASIEHGFFPPLTLDQPGRERLFHQFVINHTAYVPTLIANVNYRLMPERALRDALADRAGIHDRRMRSVSPALRKFWEKQLVERTLDTPADWQGFQRATIRDVREMAAAGVDVMAGTDTAVIHVFPGFSLHDELAMVEEAGLTPAQALRGATLLPARWFKLQDETGTIEPGKRADLVVLDDNPLQNIRNTRKIHAVVFAGDLLTHDALTRMLENVEAWCAKQVADQPPTQSPARP